MNREFHYKEANKNSILVLIFTSNNKRRHTRLSIFNNER